MNSNIILIGILAITAMMCITYAGTLEMKYAQTGLAKADTIVEISCKTDSMGLMFSCGDKAIARPFAEIEEIIDGEMYIVESPYDDNGTILHRAIWHNETHVMLKGDNNRIADPIVKREDVLMTVIGIITR